jgi:hypothetical protein
MQLVTGAQTAIQINGEIGPFFHNKRGVRQGDPISPLLFNFMADAFSSMIDAASRARQIKGVVSHLIQGGLTHLQYADDTILLLELDDNSLANLKFLLKFCLVSRLISSRVRSLSWAHLRKSKPEWQMP